MGFYEEISKYYDYIFPVSNETVEFIKKIAGNPPKSILDVACGTGDYSIELDKYGHNLTAVDIDDKMIEGLALKVDKAKTNIKFLQANMLNLDKKFDENNFDIIFCIGNSLVHLDNLDQMRDFLCNAKRLLKKDGTLIIQIINFDRIIHKEVKSLPTICNEKVGLIFERFYRYEKARHKIYFKTVLMVEDKKIENEITLTPITHDEIINMLKSAGFNYINVYGDFNKNKFDKENSYLLVVEAICLDD